MNSILSQQNCNICIKRSIFKNPVPIHATKWDTDPECKYMPVFHCAPFVINAHNEGRGGADPEIPPLDLECAYDAYGFPLHPGGRTGMFGRGCNLKWGPNLYHHLLLTVCKNGHVYFLGQAGGGVVTLPSEIVKPNQNSLINTRALIRAELVYNLEPARETETETIIDSIFSSSRIVYEGYFDDEKNTDNAWLQTSVYHINIPAVHADLFNFKNCGVGWVDCGSANMIHPLVYALFLACIESCHKEAVSSLEALKGGPDACSRRL